MAEEYSFTDAPLEGFFPEVEHEATMRALKRLFLERQTNGRINFTVVKKIKRAPTKSIMELTLSREGEWIDTLLK